MSQNGILLFFSKQDQECEPWLNKLLVSLKLTRYMSQKCESTYLLTTIVRFICLVRLLEFQWNWNRWYRMLGIQQGSSSCIRRRIQRDPQQWDTWLCGAQLYVMGRRQNCRVIFRVFRGTLNNFLSDYWDVSNQSSRWSFWLKETNLFILKCWCNGT